ncbi:MFS transporter [Chitinophagaceae bacterium LB-8]|uniref:MFS transporter n=1 Tax=Paraflavisolibacter caeni TaxID=2982496 RepID=A0A9X2XNV6_9BACT|nr:MFS transporter [Paraflavisolibacter caeni]MCU7549748.1 MFS transporter [Paraflavisolibacter caeni]
MKGTAVINMNQTAYINRPVSVQRKAGAGQAWTLIFAMFLPIMAIIGLAPALPTLMVHFNYIPNHQVLVPMLLTAPGLCIAILSPFAGRLSDLFGRRRLILIAMFIYGIGGVIPFFLENFWAVMVGRVLLGIAEAFVLTIGNALLADYFAEHERPKWLSVQGVVGPVLATVIIYGSGFLAGKGWQWPFIVYALAFPIFIAGWFYLWEPEQNKEKEQAPVNMEAFPWRTISWICLVTLVSSVIYYVYIIHFSLVLTANGITNESKIGMITAIASIAVPLGAYLFKQISGRSIFFLLLLIYALMGIGYIGMSIVHHEKWIVATAWIQQVAVGLTVPTLVAWALKSLPSEHRGLGMGFWAASFFIGQFVNPLVVGYINYLTGGILTTVMVVGIICLLLAVLVWLPKFYWQNKGAKSL